MYMEPTIIQRKAGQRAKVTVLCLTYNHQHYIEDALQGFLNQETTFPFEIIIHDDASTDRTPEILQEWQKRYPDKITLVLEKENQFSKHVFFLQSIILPMAQGRYVAICEGDDFWTCTTKLQQQFDSLEQHPTATCCVCDVVEYDDRTHKRTSKIYSDSNLKESGLVPRSKIVEEITCDYPFQTSGYFFRTDTLLTPRNENERRLFEIAFDRAILLSLASRGDFYYIKKTMSCYRVNVKGSISNTWAFNDEFFRISRRIHMNVFDLFDKATNGQYHSLMASAIEHWKTELDRSEIGALLSQGKFKDIYENYRHTTAYHKYMGRKIKLLCFLRMTPKIMYVYNWWKNR